MKRRCACRRDLMALKRDLENAEFMGDNYLQRLVIQRLAGALRKCGKPSPVVVVLDPTKKDETINDLIARGLVHPAERDTAERAWDAEQNDPSVRLFSEIFAARVRPFEW